MKSIWKFPVQIEDEFMVEMPRDTQILTVQMQGYDPFMWGIIDTMAEKIERRFRIFGTGRPFESSGEYIGTFQDGDFVWHLFETKL